jgi:AmmeMemoRadiSam system protein A/AmmeMemoRadiSam system protein B
MDASSLVFVGIAPHPPIMVPEVGREHVVEVQGSIDAMRELTGRVIASGAETIVLISPHAPLDARSFVAYSETDIAGDFANFRAPRAAVSAPLDAELLEAIGRSAREEKLQITPLEGYELDHGTAVPLYFLLRNGWRGRVVALGYSFLPNEDHLRFGAALRRAVEQNARPVAFVASGDLSHRLKPGAPAGFEPDAHLFDEQVVESIRAAEPHRIAEIDPDLRRLAGECGYRSMLVAIGACEGMRADCEVLHYEAPFGVGYLVAQLARAEQSPRVERAGEMSDGETATTENGGDAKTHMSTNEKTEAGAGADGESENLDSINSSAAPSESDADAAGAGQVLPSLARRVVETYAREGRLLKVSESDSPLLAERAACFVSIKTADGELRGCVGTVQPTRDSLAEELVSNAVAAATRDPRFPPVSARELSRLRYSVDILSEPEPCEFADLDPKNYGVIVEDESGRRLGLLLPDIEGVETAAEQVQIAARKAGIRPDESVRLQRFLVRRFGEAPSSNEQTE